MCGRKNFRTEDGANTKKKQVLSSMKTRLVLITAFLLTLVSWFPASATFQQPPPCKNAFSVDREITEGKKAAQQVYKTMPVLPDSSPVTQYIQQLGKKLTQYAPGYKWPYEFHVVNVKDINAFALPGGPIFVNLGTIQAAENEAQLAGVMAHEISHVVQRHATRAATSAQKYQIGLGILGAVLGRGVGSAIAGTVAQLGVGGVLLKNSR